MVCLIFFLAFGFGLALYLPVKSYGHVEIRVGIIKIVIVINCNIITFPKAIACNCN